MLGLQLLHWVIIVITILLPGTIVEEYIHHQTVGYTRNTYLYSETFKITCYLSLSYRYDTRGQSHLEARHWSDDDVLGGRAFFRGDQGR